MGHFLCLDDLPLLTRIGKVRRGAGVAASFAGVPASLAGYDALLALLRALFAWARLASFSNGHGDVPWQAKKM